MYIDRCRYRYIHTTYNYKAVTLMFHIGDTIVCTRPARSFGLPLTPRFTCRVYSVSNKREKDLSHVTHTTPP